MTNPDTAAEAGQPTERQPGQDQPAQSQTARLGLVLGPVAAVWILALDFGGGLAPEGRAVLALLVLMAIWWVTEAVPLAVTALLPIVALPLIGIEIGQNAAGRMVCATEGLCQQQLEAPLRAVRLMNLPDLSAHYANPIVLMYIGGFFLGLAVERSGLSQRVAFTVVAHSGAGPKAMLAGFLVAAAAISMWISNTSTSLMLTPLALSVAAGAAAGKPGDKTFAAALVLGVAYAATIGGLATPIGTPTNLIAREQLAREGIEVGFGQWMLLGLPVTLALLPIAWLILSRGLTLEAKDSAAAKTEVRAALSRMGPLSVTEGRVALVFVAVALSWALSSQIAPLIGERWLGLVAPRRFDSGHLDTIIAITGGVALFVIPAGKGAGRALLTWAEAQTIPWGIILLFGGGLALAAGAEMSGLTAWMSEGLRGLKDAPLWLTLLGVGLLVIVITEFASNIATITLMGPVLISLTKGGPPEAVAAFIAPAAMLASMGFAMPVGSASNAIAYASGALKQSDMIRRGLLMNLAALVVITAAGVWLAPVVLGR